MAMGSSRLEKLLLACSLMAVAVNGSLVNVDTPEDCKMQPVVFTTEVKFYLLKCGSGAVDLQLHGEGVFDGNGQELDWLHVDLPVALEPSTKEVKSCPGQAPEDPACETYTFDVYRQLDQGADLAQLSVFSPNRTMVLDPDFNREKKSYETEIGINEPFTISAMAKDPHTLVGIQIAEEGMPSKAGGLSDEENGCQLGLRQRATWDITLRAIGMYKYQICALLPSGEIGTIYQLKVKVNEYFSAKLRSISVSGLTLIPEFRRDVQHYEVEMPVDQKEASISLEAEDAGNDGVAGAEILWGHHGEMRSWGNKYKTAQHDRGSAKFTVHMKDNSKLKVGETPEWTRSMEIKVKSRDKYASFHYTIHLKQLPSNYSELQDISAFENCTLEQIGDGKEADAGFDARHKEYKCTWDWWQGKFAYFTPIVDPKKCTNCVIRMPNPLEDSEHHLSLKFQREQRAEWKNEDKWQRDFLFGESHTIPIEVIAEDKFSHTTYTVFMERTCPWWMSTWFLRQISFYSTTIAGFISLANVNNAMALAKQVQFMKMTTGIEGVPQQYVDFANNLKAWNLELGEYLPTCLPAQFGLPCLPTMDDFVEMRDAALEKLESQSGIPDVRLMVQYCYAKEVKGLKAGQMLLNTDPKRAKKLMDYLQSEKYKANGRKHHGALHSAKWDPDDDHDDDGSSSDDHVNKHRDAREDDDPHRRERLLLNSSSQDADPGHLNRTHSRLRGFGGFVVDEEADLGSGLIKKVRRLQESNATSFHGARRRLEDEEDEEEEVEEEIPETDIWFWMEDNWTEFMKQEKDIPGFIQESNMDCDNDPFLPLTLGAVMQFHSLMVLKHLLHSTTGSFLLLTIGIIIGGFLYILYYCSCMRGSQKRFRLLEPAQLWIVVLDYSFISFAQSCVALIFEPKHIALLKFKLTTTQFRMLCIAGLLVYPVIFVLFVFFVIWGLQKNKIHNDLQIVYDKDVGRWVDPKCTEVRVEFPPALPFPLNKVGPLKWLFTTWVRSAVPILDEDGEVLNFSGDIGPIAPKPEEPDKNEAQAPGSTERKPLIVQADAHEDEETQKKQKEGEDKIKAEVPKHGKKKLTNKMKRRMAAKQRDRAGKLYMEAEMERMDAEIEKELNRLETDTSVAKRELRRNQLKDEQAAREAYQNRMGKHKEKLKENLDKEINKKKSADSNGCPPWLHGDIKKLWHPPMVRREMAEAWPEEQDSPWTIIGIASLVGTWTSSQDRKDHELLDLEERFALIQYIKEAIRKEQKLLDYNIMKVTPHQGSLKPKEPLKNPVKDQNWLGTLEEYEDESSKIEEYQVNQEVQGKYIENAFGHRLVYEGDD